MNEEIRRIIVILKQFEKIIKKDYNAKIIGLFGSYVRNEQTKKSDVDILVKFYKGASLFDFVGLASFLEEKIGKNVDIVSDKAIRPELEEQILKEVIEI